jgi:hypothetical protein
MNSQLLRELGHLQTRQLEHDRLAHQQVLAWSHQRRLTHFTLHFAKYQATLLTTDHSRDSALRRRVLTDSLIITLATANTLGIQLADRASTFLRTCCPTSGHGLTLTSYISTVGCLAKSCEAMDHEEPFDHRQAFETGVVNLLLITARLAELEEVDLIESTHQRWSDIEADVGVSASSGFDRQQSPKTKRAEYA